LQQKKFKKKTKNVKVAPCISYKWKDAIIEEHNTQCQQPKQNVKMFDVGDFLQYRHIITFFLIVKSVKITGLIEYYLLLAMHDTDLEQ